MYTNKNKMISNQAFINPSYPSTNSVESSLPKVKTSKFLQRSMKPCKNICFWLCSNVGVSLFKYETKTNYHSQNMSKCLWMHISYFGWALVLDINAFHCSRRFISVPGDEQSLTALLINSFIKTHTLLQCFSYRFLTHLF